MQFDDLIPIDGLLAEMGLDDFPEEQKAKLQENFTRLIEDRTTILILESLDNDQKKLMESMQNDDEKLAFLQENGIVVDDILTLVVDQARVEFIKEAAYIKGYLDGVESKNQAEQNAA